MELHAACEQPHTPSLRYAAKTAGRIDCILPASVEKGKQVIHYVLCMHVCIVITYINSKDQPGKVANPACGQLNRENK